MRRFTRLHQALDSSPFHRDKSAMLAEYFSGASNEDAAWALYLMMGGQLKHAVPTALLKQWMLEETGLPEWLIQECQEQVGDLTETIMLLGDLSKDCGDEGARSDVTLSEWIENHLLPLQELSPEIQRESILLWWKTLPIAEASLSHHLLTGRFQTAVSRRLIEDALCLISGQSRDIISERLFNLPIAALCAASTYATLISAPYLINTAPHPTTLITEHKGELKELGTCPQIQPS